MTLRFHFSSFNHKSISQATLLDMRPKEMSFVEHSLALVNSNWRLAAEIAFERYRSELPVQTRTERLLDECLLASVRPRFLGPNWGTFPRRRSDASC